MSIGSSVEHAPRSAAAEEIFLTPRVLDRRAFEDYSESLKRLIKDASGEGQTLSRTASDVRALRDQLASAAHDAQKRLEAATRLLASVEQKLEPMVAQRLDGRAEGRASEAVLRAVGLNGKPGPRTRAAVDADPAPVGPAPEAIRALESSILARLEAQIETRIEARFAAAVASRVEALVEAGVQARLGAMVNAQMPGAIAAMLSGVRDQADRAMRDEIERVGTERFAAVETALATAITRVEEMGEQIEERARDAVRIETRAAVESAVSAAQIEARRPPAIDVSGQAERAADIERSLDAAARRFSAQAAEQAARVRQQAREAIDQAREECEAAVRQITTGASLRVRKAQQDADRVLESLETQIPPRLEAARARFDEALAEFTAQSHERAAWIKAAISDLAGPRVDEVRALLHQALEQANPEANGTLASSITRAEVLRQDVAVNLAQVEELAKQVGLMRDLLARSVLEGVQRVDLLDARQEELLASAARALDDYGRELETLRAAAADRAAQQPSEARPGASRAAEPMDIDATEPSEHAQAALAEAEQRFESLRTQTEEAARAAEWLTALIDRAAGAGIALDESLAAPQLTPPARTSTPQPDALPEARPDTPKPARRRRAAVGSDPTGDGAAR